mmetsp:Transcript_29048/g.55767  ORF Transcript_29048/g.55767 Transcript_29048/m.55767 type:complete len:204 (-) Transcript_29048:117-728(-)
MGSSMLPPRGTTPSGKKPALGVGLPSAAAHNASPYECTSCSSLPFPPAAVVLSMSVVPTARGIGLPGTITQYTSPWLKLPSPSRGNPSLGTRTPGSMRSAPPTMKRVTWQCFTSNAGSKLGEDHKLNTVGIRKSPFPFTSISTGISPLKYTMPLCGAPSLAMDKSPLDGSISSSCSSVHLGSLRSSPLRNFLRSDPLNLCFPE